MILLNLLCEPPPLPPPDFKYSWFQELTHQHRGCRCHSHCKCLRQCPDILCYHRILKPIYTPWSEFSSITIDILTVSIEVIVLSEGMPQALVISWILGDSPSPIHCNCSMLETGPSTWTVGERVGKVIRPEMHNCYRTNSTTVSIANCFREGKGKLLC